MERNANYFLVGLISAVLLTGLLVFVVLLAGRKFSRDYDVYDIVFQGPVRGLAQGGGQDRAPVKRVTTLASLDFHMFTDQLAPLRLGEAGNGGALRLDAQAGLALGAG